MEVHAIQKHGEFIEQAGYEKAPIFKSLFEQPRVLIVDDDFESATLMSHLFTDLGFDVETARTAEAAYRQMRSSKYDLVVLDWLLGRQDTGEDVLSWVQRDMELKDEEDEEPLSFDIVTFSELKLGDIHVPSFERFRHLEHWRKPVDYASLVSRALNLIGRVDL